MKLFGNISELVAVLFRKDSQDLTLRPNQSTTYTAARDIQLPPGDAAHVLTSANSTQTLTNKTIDASANTVSNVSLSTMVTGTLPIANGGTGQTGKTAAFDALSPGTTKGDLIVYDGSDNIRLGVGSDGTVLSSASGQTSGLQWVSVLSNPMDSEGDLIVGGASGAATKLDAGASNTVLIGGTSPSFALLANANISDSAAIAHSKLAGITGGNILMGNGSGIATSTAVSGDVTISSSGVTAIGSGVIVNTDVHASAAIAGTKISPNFGSQNIVTTGTAQASSITLATSGGTASALNYYEEYSVSAAYTGPFAGNTTIYLVKVGKMVNMYFSSIGNTDSTSTAAIALTGAIVARFRPVGDFIGLIKKNVGTTSSDEVAQVTVGSNGTITIYRTLGQAGFTSGTNYGIPPFSVSWQVT